MRGSTPYKRVYGVEWVFVEDAASAPLMKELGLPTSGAFEAPDAPAPAPKNTYVGTAVYKGTIPTQAAAEIVEEAVEPVVEEPEVAAEAPGKKLVKEAKKKKKEKEKEAAVAEEDE